MQGPPKNVPRLFNPAEDYDDRSVLVVTLSEKTITLTAKEVTGMPWQQFVRLMKVRASITFQIGAACQRPGTLCRKCKPIGSLNIVPISDQCLFKRPAET